MSDIEPRQEEDAFIQKITEALTKSIPTKMCAEANRLPLAESFLDTLGRLVEFAEQFKPMNHAQMAAFMFFVDTLNIRRLGFDDGMVVMTIFEGAKRAAREVRRADGPKGNPS